MFDFKTFSLLWIQVKISLDFDILLIYHFLRIDMCVPGHHKEVNLFESNLMCIDKTTVIKQCGSEIYVTQFYQFYQTSDSRCSPRGCHIQD